MALTRWFLPKARMKEDLHRTRWNRLAIRLHVPPAMGVFMIAAQDGESPEPVLLVGSARNLRQQLLQLLDMREIQAVSAAVVHWVADLTFEQARLAERQLIRRYNPPLNLAPATRYLDILAG